MRNIYLVKQEQADLARRIEAKLLELPLSSGILFVGVSVTPATDVREYPVYQVCVGCHRDFDEGWIDPVVRVTLRQEITDGAHVQVEAHRGISRSHLKLT